MLFAELSPTLPVYPSELELAFRVLLAAVLVSLIGLEREVTDHPSGMRTHVLVGVGACLFGICSAYAFSEFVAFRNDNNYQIDVTRVASQVVVGVGFLGGGAIVKQGNSIRGLTSAAGLWVSSAIGLAVALGMYVPAIVVTVTLLLSLTMLRRPRRWIRAHLLHSRENVVIRIPLSADPGPVITVLEALEDCVIEGVVVRRRPDDDLTMIEAEVNVKGGMLATRISPIEQLPAVLSVEVS